MGSRLELFVEALADERTRVGDEEPSSPYTSDF